jgi:hypothetical protein
MMGGHGVAKTKTTWYISYLLSVSLPSSQAADVAREGVGCRSEGGTKVVQAHIHPGAAESEFDGAELRTIMILWRDDLVRRRRNRFTAALVGSGVNVVPARIVDHLFY